MTKRGVLFFATKNDLYQNLKMIEQNRSIKYVKYSRHDSKDYLVYYSVDNFQNLGISTTSGHNSGGFLVLDRDTEIIPKEVKQLAGGVKYYIDQDLNPTSIVFWPGGFWGNDYLIHGQVTIMLGDEAAKDLYKYFTKNLVKGFKKYREYYVGLEALEMAERVRLITVSVNESMEYDLKLVSQ